MKHQKASKFCTICGFKLYTIKRETYNQIIKMINPTIKSIPVSIQKGKDEFLPICPQCDAYALGLDMDEGFPIIDEFGNTIKIQSIENSLWR